MSLKGVSICPSILEMIVVNRGFVPLPHWYWQQKHVDFKCFVLVSFRTSSSIVTFTFWSFSSSMSLNFLVSNISGIVRSNAGAGDWQREKWWDFYSLLIPSTKIYHKIGIVQKVNSPKTLVVPLSTCLFFANSQNLFSWFQEKYESDT